jgi:hypothetical protein
MASGGMKYVAMAHFACGKKNKEKAQHQHQNHGGQRMAEKPAAENSEEKRKRKNISGISTMVGELRQTDGRLWGVGTASGSVAGGDLTATYAGGVARRVKRIIVNAPAASWLWLAGWRRLGRIAGYISLCCCALRVAKQNGA